MLLVHKGISHMPIAELENDSESIWVRVFANKTSYFWFLFSFCGKLVSRKGGKTIDLNCYIKVLKVKPVYQQMTLSPKLGVVEISTLWHFRLQLIIQVFIKKASSPRLSGIGMPPPILWSHLLKMQRIMLLSSLLWWELGTNSLITGPGEWLSFRRFSSKLSLSWFSVCFGYRNVPKFSDRQVWANSADPDQTAQGLHCLQFPLHLLDALL